MTTAPQVSLVIPIYHIPDDLLRDCLTSLHAQTLLEAEFLCVIDGPDPRAEALVQSFVDTDPRFVLKVLPENKGVSIARNTGLEMARGAWFGFVDADDTVAPAFCQRLLNATASGHPDIVCAYFHGASQNRVRARTPFLPADGLFHLDDPSQAPQVYIRADATACAKLFSSAFLPLRFTPGQTNLEDVAFLWRALRQASTVRFLAAEPYHVVSRANSASRALLSDDALRRYYESLRALLGCLRPAARAAQLWQLVLWGGGVDLQMQSQATPSPDCRQAMAAFWSQLLDAAGKDIPASFRRHIRRHLETPEYLVRPHTRFHSILWANYRWHTRAARSESAWSTFRSAIFRSHAPERQNVILTDGDPAEIEDFRRGLEDAVGAPFVIRGIVCNRGARRWWRELWRYGMYFWVPFLTFLRRRRYGIVVGWQQFFAVLFCWYAEIFHARKKSVVAVKHLIYHPKKGLAGRLYHRMMSRVVRGTHMDLAAISSEQHIRFIETELGMPAGRALSLPFGVPDIAADYASSSVPEGRGFALAIGRSNRDFDWLVREWRQLPSARPLVIISDQWEPAEPLPSGVTLLRTVTNEKQFPYFANCSLVILPLLDGTFASGDTVVLNAMVFSKPVIVSSPSTAADLYVRDSQNGLAVDKTPGNLAARIAAVPQEDWIRMGQAGRLLYEQNFTRYALGFRMGERLNSILGQNP